MTDPGLPPPDPAILSDADLASRVRLRVPRGHLMRQYTCIIDAGARVVWRGQTSVHTKRLSVRTQVPR